MKEERPYLRSPMAERNLYSTAEKRAAPKDFGIARHMLSDSNTDTYSFKQLMSLGEEKENNPEAGQLPPSRARRFSVCNGGTQPMESASRRNSLIPLPRRNSLMPLHIAKPLAAATPPPLDRITEHLSPPMCSPPVVSNDKASRSRRIGNIPAQKPAEESDRQASDGDADGEESQHHCPSD
jgi:kinesin family member C2/C3